MTNAVKKVVSKTKGLISKLMKGVGRLLLIRRGNDGNSAAAVANGSRPSSATLITLDSLSTEQAAIVEETYQG